MLQVRTAKQSVGYNGIPDRVISRVAPAFAQPQNYTGSGNRRRFVVSTLISGVSRGHRLSNGATREGSVTVRFASDANKRRNMSELPPISNRDTSSRSWRSSKSSGASALPRGAVVAYEKPMLLSVDGQLADESFGVGVGGAVKRTFSSPGQNTASSGNSRLSISCKSQGVASTGTGNNNNVRAPATQRLATQCDKSANFAKQKPKTIGYYDTGGGVTSTHQSGLKRAKSFGNLPRQPSVPGGNSKARSAKLTTAGSKQFAYTNSSAATSRRLARHADKQPDTNDAPSQNGVEPPTAVTSDSDIDVEKQDMILQWLIGVDDLAERPLSPDCIHHCGPEQSDTAIHIVYDGD